MKASPLVRSASTGLFVALLAATPVLHAQSSSDKAAAEALFDEARRLMENKRYTEACPKFADSQRLDPGVGTLLNLALCYKQNGQTASSWSTYREAAARARTAHQDDREALAREEAAALERTLTRLVIQVSPAATAIPGLEVKRDGTVVPHGLWGVPAPVDPGVRVIDATAPGKKPFHLEAKAEGAGATATVVIPALEDAGSVPAAVASAAPVATQNATPEPAPTTPPPAKDQGKSPGSGQRAVGYVVGSVGIVGIAAGTFFGLLSIALDKAAARTSSESKERKYRNDADSARTVAFVSLGGGGACLIGGIVLVVTAPSKPKKTARFELLPELGDGELGVRLHSAF